MANIDLNTVMLLLIALMNFAGIVIGVLSRKEQSAKLDVLKAQTDGLTSALVLAEKVKGEVKAAALARDDKVIAAGGGSGDDSPSPVDIKQSVPLELKVVK